MSERRCESKVSPTRSRGPGRREREALQHVDVPVEGATPFNSVKSTGSGMNAPYPPVRDLCALVVVENVGETTKAHR